MYISPLKYTVPSVAILHAGGNDLANNINEEVIVENLAYLGCVFKSKGAKHIAISSMCPRINLKDEIPSLNRALSTMCKTYGYDFIDNSNIKYRYRANDGYYKSHLSYDRIHLNYDGVEILNSNFISYLKNLKVDNEEWHRSNSSIINNVFGKDFEILSNSIIDNQIGLKKDNVNEIISNQDPENIVEIRSSSKTLNYSNLENLEKEQSF